MSIAVLGFGVVGQGVVDILQREQIASVPPISHVIVRDPHAPRDVSVPGIELSTDVESALADPGVSIVVEVNGEVTRNRELLADAMRAGKHVVTANKALLSAHFEELTDVARTSGVQLRYEAAVAAGIPIIAQVQALTPVSAVGKVSGIINGSCNWLLSTMAERGCELTPLIAEAQELGYLEADPSADLDGWDALRKLRILATLAFGRPVTEDDIDRASIASVTLAKVLDAQEQGFAVKQVAKAEIVDGRVVASVGPARVPVSSLLGGVNGATNAVALDVEHLGELVLIGQGAGRYPTAHAVVSDVVAVCRRG